MLRWLVILFTFSIAGAVASLPFVLRADNLSETAARLVPCAALSAGVCGVSLWLIFSPESGPRWRAPTAGATAGLLAHPVMWFLISLQTGSGVGISAEQLVAGGILATLFFSFFSILIYGPLTVTLGAMVGWVLDRLLVKTRTTSSVAANPSGASLP